MTVDPVKGTLALVEAAGGVVFGTTTGDNEVSDPVVVGMAESVAGCFVGFPVTTAAAIVLAAAVTDGCSVTRVAGPEVRPVGVIDVSCPVVVLVVD